MSKTMTKAEKKLRDRQLTKEQALQHKARLLLTRLLETPAENPPQNQMSSRLGRALKALGWFWGMIVVASILVGLVVGVMALPPQISATPIEEVNPPDPSAVLVTMWNNNPYEIRDAWYSCTQVEAMPPKPGDVLRGNMFDSKDSALGNLAAHAPVTISCKMIGRLMSKVIGGQVSTVDFMITFSFRPWFIPGILPQVDWWLFHLPRTERKFRFVAMRDQSGRIHVTPQPKIEIPELEQFSK